MTDTSKTVRKTGGKPRTTAKRDAYDDFLDEVEGKPAAPAKKRAATTAKGRKDAAGETRKPSTATVTRTKTTKKATGDGRSRDLLAAWEELSGERETAPKRSVSAKRQTARSGSATSGRADRSAASGTQKPARKNGTGSNGAETTPKSVGGTRNRSTTASARKRAARDPYDAFLDAAGEAPSPRKSVGKARKRSAVLLVDNESGRDPYDDFLDAAEKKLSKRSGGAHRGLTVALIVGILCILGLAGWQTAQYRTFLVMKSAVNQQTFYAGTTVEGVDVSGMTLAQALEHWEQGIEPGYYERTVAMSNGASFTAAELGYSSDYATVLTNAWSAGRAGTLEERYEAISNRRRDPVSYVVSRIPYTQEAIQTCVAAIAEQVDRPAQEAKIQSFNTETYQFTFVEEATGSRLDAEALAADMARALDAGGGSVELKMETVQPAVKKADIASGYGMIAAAVTNASSSSSNRLNNIRLALSLINGVCLKPGETFSFNETVGKRTTERGFKTATAYSGGEVTEEVGGGICQVSTTLFNAAVKADLEIVERHNHSLTVAYVDKGKDASVNWSSQDLRFTNTSGDDIYICCVLDGDKRVRVGIFGKLLPNGEYITVEGVTTDTIPYETVMQPSLSVAPGATQVTQKGKNGYRAEAYKLRWDANGNQISRELLCKSTYKAVTEVIAYGP